MKSGEAESKGGHDGDAIELAFDRFLSQLEHDQGQSFDAWLADRPSEEREGLERLHSEWRRGLSLLARRDRASEAVELGRALFPGARIADFRLIHPLGRGGQGSVWEAEQLSLGRRVALKLLRSEALDRERLERAFERFRREAQAGARLRHKNLVAIYQWGEEAELAWIAQELVPGGRTLKQRIDEVRSLPQVPKEWNHEVASLIAQVADALAAAHELGILHRDVKPSNVLLDADATPRVGDFGLAAIIDHEALSGSEQVPGTLLYMSPEQVRGRRAELDARTDVFSLGVVLYELLTLRRPFEGDSVTEIARKIEAWDPPDPRTVRVGIARELALIAAKSLEKERPKRYQTMADLAADLRRYLANEPILAKPSTPVERLVKWARRNPVRSVAGAIASAAFAVIATLLAVNLRTNKTLTEERSNLAEANKTLDAKSRESEERRIAAEQSGQQARDEKDRADHEAAAAMRRADEVLRLSSLQRLEDLTSEADHLWPAHPENIKYYEKWLGQAEKLVAELPDHEAKLAELRTKARPWTPEEQEEYRASQPKAKDIVRLEREIAFLKQRSAVLEGGDPGPEPTAEEVGVDFASLPRDAASLNELARSLVEPKRQFRGDEQKGLVLARQAVKLATEAQRPRFRDTLAWALLALGRLDDAMAEEQQALEEAPADKRPELEGYLASLREAIESELDPKVQELAGKQASELEAEHTWLESELPTRPEWTFDDAKDNWWYNQLEKLVKGIHSFADERMGLFSDGTSPEFGWGIKKRLANAIALEEGFAPDGVYARTWAAALPAINTAYPGLSLTQQLGLVPIGPDPESKLWEFAHLETGEPAVRGADGKLLLTETTGLVLVLLPGKAFCMGAQARDPNGPNYDPQAWGDEGPVHNVMVSAFFISKYEMTQGQWMRFVGKNPSYYKAGETVKSLTNPVEQVGWLDCIHVMYQLGLSLPTETQWEYGARAGTSTVWWTGNDRNSLLGAANLADQAAARIGVPWSDIKDWPELDDGYALHAPVNAFRPNRFGLHNVHGNVFEWCLDGYDQDYYRLSATRDPFSPPVGPVDRVNRGGSYPISARNARSANRNHNPPVTVDNDLGLRPARAVER